MPYIYILILLLFINECEEKEKESPRESREKVQLSLPKVLNSNKSKPKLELGIASFYANKFHKKPTASGELYDKDDLTAAHKSLPFGTIVKVTMLSNKKSVIVRINDRGPRSKNRIIDLSYKAAREIMLIRAGISKVQLEILNLKQKISLL